MSEEDIRQFESGAVRSKDADNTRYDLISPIALRRLAETCAEGAKRYGDHNWLKGMPCSDVMNHCLRHLFLWMSGDTTEDHLAHSMWNVMALIHFEETRPDLMDIPTRSVFTITPGSPCVGGCFIGRSPQDDVLENELDQQFREESIDVSGQDERDTKKDLEIDLKDFLEGVENSETLSGYVEQVFVEDEPYVPFSAYRKLEEERDSLQDQVTEYSDLLDYMTSGVDL